MQTVYVNLALVAINFGVLALQVKLYTEILKDARFNQRAKGRLPEEDPDEA